MAQLSERKVIPFPVSPESAARISRAAEVIQGQPVLQPAEVPSLVTSLPRKKLTVEERRTALAINALPILPQTQRLLFAADLYSSKDGPKRAEKLGFGFSELASGRDYVVTDPEGGTNWMKVKKMREDSSLLIVANLRKYNWRTWQIEGLLKRRRGASEKQVRRKTDILVELGLGKRKDIQTRDFDSFCVEVARVDRENEGSPLSARALAEKLVVPQGRIEEARIRNRNQGQPSTPGLEEIRQKLDLRKSAIERAMLANPSEGNVQILARLKDDYPELTRSMVQHARNELIGRGAILSMRPDLTAKRKNPQK